MGATSWMIGSNPAIAAGTVGVQVQTEIVDTLDVLTSESPLYLYDGGTGFDALLALRAAIRNYDTGGNNLDNSTVYLTRDRRVRIEFLDGTNTPISTRITAFAGSGGATLQEMYGFDAAQLNAGYATTLTATHVSPYLWSPNAHETPDARAGALGIPYFDTAVGQSGTRVVVATTNNSGYINNFRWPNVENTRYWSASPVNGEYFIWFEFVQRRFRKFKLYREVNELDGSTTAATLPTGLGPYVWRYGGQAPLTFPMSRDIDFLEFLHTVEIPVVVVDEYE